MHGSTKGNALVFAHGFDASQGFHPHALASDQGAARLVCLFYCDTCADDMGSRHGGQIQQAVQRRAIRQKIIDPKVMCMQQPTYGKDNQRIKTGVDPDLDCDDFERGEASGMCDGMGHYHCDECKYRNPESIRQKHEDWLYHMAHKKEWTKIKARVIDTGEEVMVDDQPIVQFGTSYYNMWHNTENGMTYHDDDLEFIDERLQKID